MSKLPPLHLAGIQEALDEIARLLGHSVEVTTPSINVIAASAQVGVIDTHRAKSILNRTPPPEPIPWMLSFGIQESLGPVRLPAHKGFDMLPRVVFPLRRRGTLVGHLWFIDEPALSDADLASVQRYIEPLARLVDERDASLAARADQLDEMARAILAGHDNALASARDQDLFPRDGQLKVHRVYVDGNQEQLALDLARPLRRRPYLTASLHDSLAIIESPRDAADTQALRDEVASAVLTVGGRLTAWGSASAAEVAVGAGARRARLMADVARLIGADSLDWADAGAWRLLLGWDLSPATVRALSPDAAALLDEPRNSYWRTLLAYCEHSRNVNETAADLFIHRATLHYRLDRVRDILGADALEEGWRCAALHVALKLHAALEGEA